MSQSDAKYFFKNGENSSKNSEIISYLLLKKETENCVEAIYQLHRELIYSSNKKVENEVAFSGTCSSADKGRYFNKVFVNKTVCNTD